ncbi:MAG TPA: hypothetical protein VFT21_00610 [Gemmatimonadaceae bacterium]|nr:hypothetical protein [Gemmatimonadaceae bacterium]
MQLPFSESDFLDVFGAYNTAQWPAVLALWIASGFVFMRLLRGAKPDRGITLCFSHRLTQRRDILSGLRFEEARGY